MTKKMWVLLTLLACGCEHTAAVIVDYPITPGFTARKVEVRYGYKTDTQ